VQKLLYAYALSLGVSKKRLSLILQYPENKKETGVVVHWPNHLDHLHVRFRHRGVPILKNAKKYCDSRKISPP